MKRLAQTRAVFDDSWRVAEWMATGAGARPIQFHSAIGIEAAGELIGGFMFTAYNGSDVELHYYGPGTLQRRTVRLIFSYALRVLQVNRVTVRTRKPHMARGCEKLGAVYECTVRRLYGPTDADEDAGRQYAFFRETIEKLAAAKD